MIDGGIRGGERQRDRDSEGRLGAGERGKLGELENGGTAHFA